jgi:hypothetical protein
MEWRFFMDLSLKNRSGSGLLDIAVAMLILGFALCVCLLFMTNAAVMTKEIKSRKIANLSGEKKLSELSVQASPIGGTDKDTVNGVPCVRSWSISDTGFVRKLTVVVAYKTLRGRDKQLTLSGVLSK